MTVNLIKYISTPERSLTALPRFELVSLDLNVAYMANSRLPLLLQLALLLGRIGETQERQQMVDVFGEHAAVAADFQARLGKLPDLERLLAKAVTLLVQFQR